MWKALLVPLVVVAAVVAWRWHAKTSRHPLQDKYTVRMRDGTLEDRRVYFDDRKDIHAARLRIEYRSHPDEEFRTIHVADTETKLLLDKLHVDGFEPGLASAGIPTLRVVFIGEEGAELTAWFVSSRRLERLASAHHGAGTYWLADEEFHEAIRKLVGPQA
jgi:hypothetical protein